jgi:hypothetical protein
LLCFRGARRAEIGIRFIASRVFTGIFDHSQSMPE